VKELREIGIQPDILLCRSEHEISKELREKIGLFCNLDSASVITAQDVSNIYELPLQFHEQDLDDRILEKLNIWAAEPHLEKWRAMMDRWKTARQSVRIAIVGKYVHLADTYKSLNEALAHGGNANKGKVDLKYVDSEQLDDQNLVSALGDCDAVLVPGGFGERGVEGKIAAIRWAREQGVPFFGICLGLQLAVIEYARTILGHADANSREFLESGEHTTIELMDAQRNVTDKGGTMRLGAWPCLLEDGSLAQRVYRTSMISERHRHRYEVNPAYFDALEAAGLRISGRSPDGRLAEMIEINNHPYFIGCQFHPEFKSRPHDPHPLFATFIRAAIARRESTGRGRLSQEEKGAHSVN
jgi:CTP synthase